MASTTKTTAAATARLEGLWAQTRSSVTLTLRGSAGFESASVAVEFQPRRLVFSAAATPELPGSDIVPARYALELDLVDEINVQACTFEAHAFEVRVTIVKAGSGYWWPRLLETKAKQHWLRVNFDNWEGDSDGDVQITHTSGEDRYDNYFRNADPFEGMDMGGLGGGALGGGALGGGAGGDMAAAYAAAAAAAGGGASSSRFGFSDANDEDDDDDDEDDDDEDDNDDEDNVDNVDIVDANVTKATGEVAVASESVEKKNDEAFGSSLAVNDITSN